MLGMGIGELVIMAVILVLAVAPPLVLVGLAVWIFGRRGPTPADAPAPPAHASPQPAAGMQVVEMEVRGFLRLEGDFGRVEEPWPDSPLGAGEFPTGAWIDHVGRVFCVGKLYSGAPGPDDGAVYRRDPDGSWTLVHRLEGRTLHSVAGTADGLVVAGAMGGVLVLDGGQARFVELPYPMVVKVWPGDGGVRAQSFDRSQAWRLTAGADPVPVEPTAEPERRLETFTRGGVTATVFDRSWEVGESVLGADEAAELNADFEALQRALADGSAEVRTPFDPDA